MSLLQYYILPSQAIHLTSNPGDSRPFLSESLIHMYQLIFELLWAFVEEWAAESV